MGTPQGTFEAAGKFYGKCNACGQVVRIDKPIFGSLHVCQPSRTSEAVAMLDKLDAGDPETAHIEADAILLASVPPEVRDAYMRLRARCRWWAYA